MAQEILKSFNQFRDIRSESLEYLGNNGGYSGARLWRFTSQDQRYLARRFAKPASDRKKRIYWIQRTIHTAYGNGCDFLAPTIVNESGNSLIDDGDFLWQIEKWLPGSATFWSEPNISKLKNAARAIARFHSLQFLIAKQQHSRPTIDLLASSFDSLGNSNTAQSIYGEPQSIDDRIGLCHRHSKVDLKTIFKEMESQPSSIKSLLQQEAIEIHQRFNRNVISIVRELEQVKKKLRCSNPYEFATASVCFRDVWHDHLLFDGNRLTGIVDYDAMRWDWVVNDIARLLASLFGSRFDQAPEDWEKFLKEYVGIFPLTQFDMEMLGVIDRANSILAPMNWVTWIYCENRDFGESSKIRQRIGRLIVRMPH